MKSQLIGKDPDAGKDWRQYKGTTEDEMVGWHHWLDGHEFEQALGDGAGLCVVCCSPWIAESQTWPSNWTTTVQYLLFSQHLFFCFLTPSYNSVNINFIEFFSDSHCLWVFCLFLWLIHQLYLYHHTSARSYFSASMTTVTQGYRLLE